MVNVLLFIPFYSITNSLDIKAVKVCQTTIIVSYLRPFDIKDRRWNYTSVHFRAKYFNFYYSQEPFCCIMSTSTYYAVEDKNPILYLNSQFSLD